MPAGHNEVEDMVEATPEELNDGQMSDGDAKPARRSPLRRRGVRLILLLIAILALVGIAAWLIHYQTVGKYLESTNDAYLAADSVTVSPKISGYVEEVYVRDNQDVKAGQPLVRVDPREYRAQASQYQAQIDLARANADNVRAGISEQQAAIAQARAQLDRAREDARFAAGEVVRYEPLAASGAETRERLTALRNQAVQANSAVVASRAALTSAERRVASLRAQVRQAGAQGEAAEAQLGAANVNLTSTIIRASVNGRVASRSVRVGQFVQAGTRMMTVVPLGSLYLTANFKETQIGLMRVGQPATIKVDALDGVSLRGHLESLSPGTGAEFSLLPPQNATGNFTKIVQRVPVRIAVDAGPDARRVLMPGLSVTVEVDTTGAKGERDRIEQQEDARRDARRTAAKGAR